MMQSKIKFEFAAPVFLEKNQTYSLVVKAPTSLNYTIWTAKVGENLLEQKPRLQHNHSTVLCLCLPTLDGRPDSGYDVHNEPSIL